MLPSLTTAKQIPSVVAKEAFEPINMDVRLVMPCKTFIEDPDPLVSDPLFDVLPIKLAQRQLSPLHQELAEQDRCKLNVSRLSSDSVTRSLLAETTNCWVAVSNGFVDVSGLPRT